mmetsp:Transcript_11757/g.18852  ORF Transcript_11757/g.18852 Transcript_11757/m.18852 type:complete len:98 (-) Transcript_11757:119-412(-)
MPERLPAKQKASHDRFVSIKDNFRRHGSKIGSCCYCRVVDCMSLSPGEGVEFSESRKRELATERELAPRLSYPSSDCIRILIAFSFRTPHHDSLLRG